MAEFARVFGVFLIIAVITNLVAADCYINFPSEPERVPRYDRKLGLKWLKVPHTSERVNIYGDETIYAECAYGFSTPSDAWLRKESDIALKCGNGEVYAYTRSNVNDTAYHYKDYFSNGATFSCSGPNLHIYQSMETFDWCEPHTESYFIQTELLHGQNYTLAYFCYYVEGKQLQTITYKAGHKYHPYDHSRMIFPNWPLINVSNDASMEVHNFVKVLSHNFAAEYLNNQVIKNIWLKLASYSYSPPVQIAPYANFFSELNSALDIVWWPNLLHGNWQRFNEALEKHANKVEYTVTTGTSGLAEVPHQDPLTGKLELQVLRLDTVYTTIPKYIWSYGISDDRKDSFLVVSYNSPYFNLTNKEETIFCQDICDQYDWLKEARSTFSFPIMGVTFCCSIDEAVDVLRGLPIAFLNEGTAANQTTTSNTSDISSTPNTSTDI